MSFTDVVNQQSIEKSVEEVGRLVQDEGLNCLINNAGINVVADFNSVTAEKMLENFHTNAVAPLMITKVMFAISFCVCLSVVDQLRDKKRVCLDLQLSFYQIAKNKGKVIPISKAELYIKSLESYKNDLYVCRCRNTFVCFLSLCFLFCCVWNVSGHRHV